MLRILFRVYLPIILLFLFLTSCLSKKPSEKEAAFAKLYPIKIMSRKLKLSVEYLSGPIAQGYAFDIWVENISDGPIWFANDLGIKIYKFDEVSGQWQEVQNNMRYSGVSVVVDPKGENTPNIYSTGLIPVLPEGYNGKTVRVVVIGKIYRGGSPTDELAGAWMDVALPAYK